MVSAGLAVGVNDVDVKGVLIEGTEVFGVAEVLCAHRPRLESASARQATIQSLVDKICKGELFLVIFFLVIFIEERSLHNFYFL